MNRIILIVFIIFIISTFLITRERFQNRNIKYIYWTGGYDSTYAICNALINGKKTVQPIYISYNLDNSSTNKFWVRRNRKQELQSMDKIRKQLAIKFPDLQQNLLPNWYVTKNIPDDDFTNKFNNENLFPKKRKIHQYEHLARFAYVNNIMVDLGVLGIHESTKFIKFLKENLENIDGELFLPFEHPLKNLCFPLFGKSKYQLLENARESNFDDILKLTWSCWFPTKEGLPCNKCPMCIERII